MIFIKEKYFYQLIFVDGLIIPYQILMRTGLNSFDKCKILKAFQVIESFYKKSERNGMRLIHSANKIVIGRQSFNAFYLPNVSNAFHIVRKYKK